VPARKFVLGYADSKQPKQTHGDHS